MEIVALKGTHEEIGYELGVRLSEAIRHNIYLQDQNIVVKEIAEEEINRFVNRYAMLVAPTSLRLMESLSRGSGISFEAILRYNALQDTSSSEECTTFAAIGKATSNGNPVLLKNRDTSGNFDFHGSGYYHYREINVVLALKTDDGNSIVGVSAAGSTGVVMGLNKHGVAVASNSGRLTEVSGKSSKELYGISGRTQILREGLECASAYEAVNLALQKLTKSPMGSPGMLFFVDNRDVYVVEGGSLNDQFAVQHFTDGAMSRSNHFELLDQLNDPDVVSTICRKIRAKDLVNSEYGKINKDKLIEFSMDHRNGPGDNSICRHNKEVEEGVTVSAAIMEIERDNPAKSKISIALGTPCQAWNNEAGNITIQMDEDFGSIPQAFLDGSAFKQFIRPEPFLE